MWPCGISGRPGQALLPVGNGATLRHAQEPLTAHRRRPFSLPLSGTAPRSADSTQTRCSPSARADASARTAPNPAPPGKLFGPPRPRRDGRARPSAPTHPRSETLSLPWRRAQGAELTAGQVPAGRAHPKGPPPGQCVAEGHSRPPTAGRPGGDVSREAELHQCARQTLLVPTEDGPKLDL